MNKTKSQKLQDNENEMATTSTSFSKTLKKPNFIQKTYSDPNEP